MRVFFSKCFGTENFVFRFIVLEIQLQILNLEYWSVGVNKLIRNKVIDREKSL